MLTPKDSFELYQKMAYADRYEEFIDLMYEEEGTIDNNLRDMPEEYISKESFEYISERRLSPALIDQFTLFTYEDRTYLIQTSPWTIKKQIFKIVELPEEVREYFISIDGRNDN